jgi:iron complex transport system substrate-binding protein
MLRKFLLPPVLLFSLVLWACAPHVAPTPASLSSTMVPGLGSTDTPAAVTPSGVTITDGLGRTVALAAPARRIVSLAPSLTEDLIAVGAGAQLVGRDENSDFPPLAKDVENIGSTNQTLNTEAILTLKPDLVVAAGINTPEQVKALDELGLTVYYFANPTEFNGMYKDLKTMGQLTGHESEAVTLVKSLQARVDDVTQKAANVTQKPKVFYEIDASSSTDMPWTSGPHTFMDAMITQAGGVNIGGVLTDPFAQMSLEVIVEQDPDIIILGDTAFGVTPEAVSHRQGWGDLTAVRNKAILPFDDNLASRPGPRLVDGLEALARILHPDLFK